jgi:ligand-binding sensor domain-containing protein
MRGFVVLLLTFPILSWASFQRIQDLPFQVDIVCISPFNDELIYVTSGPKLYQKRGNYWRMIYRLKEGNINFIYFDPEEAGLVFIATDKGLLLTRDGEGFRYVFKGRHRQIRCYHVKRRGKFIYLGTNDGLYVGEMDNYNFRKVAELPDEIEIYWIEFSNSFIYLATDRGLYVGEGLRGFKRIFLIRREEEEVLEKDPEREELGKPKTQIVFIDCKGAERIYLGTEDGLYISQNGSSFSKVYLGGISNLGINHMLQDRITGILYLATEKGFFKFYPGRKVMERVYDGLGVGEINYIAINNKGRIYLATSKGLFVEGKDGRELALERYEKIFSDEPTILEVQRAALSYNEVSPDKIRKWRRALKLRALMPTIDVGYDKTVNFDSYDNRYWVGPRDWSLDLSWDLGNLIWNNYEDDVDTRSRLNTQLRLDILEEVNRLYFERRRVKFELLNKPPQDPEEYVKKLMYLEELTAALDAYTGGYFSKRLKELKGKR